MEGGGQGDALESPSEGPSQGIQLEGVEPMRVVEVGMTSLVDRRVMGDLWYSLPDSLKGVATVEGFKIGYDKLMKAGGKMTKYPDSGTKCTQPRVMNRNIL